MIDQAENRYLSNPCSTERRRSSGLWSHRPITSPITQKTFYRNLPARPAPRDCLLHLLICHCLTFVQPTRALNKIRYGYGYAYSSIRRDTRTTGHRAQAGRTKASQRDTCTMMWGFWIGRWLVREMKTKIKVPRTKRSQTSLPRSWRVQRAHRPSCRARLGRSTGGTHQQHLRMYKVQNVRHAFTDRPKSAPVYDYDCP